MTKEEIRKGINKMKEQIKATDFCIRLSIICMYFGDDFREEKPTDYDETINDLLNDTSLSYEELELKAKVLANQILQPKPTKYLDVMQTTWYLYDKERGVI